MSDIFSTWSLNWIEMAGYLASALVFLTFCMKTLIPLRLMAIASNVVFIIYAIGAGLAPVLLLHAGLLPLNILRTYEQIRIYRRVRNVSEGGADVKDLIPFMHMRLGPSGEVLFRKGDTAQDIYYISKGRIHIPEIGKILGPGTLFGEMAIFTSDQTRTASAICHETCELMVMSKDDIIRHCTTDPAFGLFLARLVVSRMTENQQSHPKTVR